MTRFVQHPQPIEDGPRFQQSHGSIGGHGCSKQEECSHRDKAPRTFVFVNTHLLLRSALGSRGCPSLHFVLASFARTIASLSACPRSKFHLHFANTRGNKPRSMSLETPSEKPLPAWFRGIPT